MAIVYHKSVSIISYILNDFFRSNHFFHRLIHLYSAIKQPLYNNLITHYVTFLSHRFDASSQKATAAAWATLSESTPCAMGSITV